MVIWLLKLRLGPGLVSISPLNPIQDGPFPGCSRMGGGEGAKRPPFFKICHTYPILMKLGTVIHYLEKIQKIHKSSDTPFEFCWHHRKSAIFVISGNTGIDSHFNAQFLDFFTFLESSNVVLIIMGEYLMMSAKLATLSLLKLKVFWNKGYDDIISVYDVTNEILSRDSNYIVEVVMRQSLVTLAFLWEKLS